MSIKNANKIINLMSDLKIKRCILIGGEPTLYPGIFSIISLGASKGLKMSMVTNGRLLENQYFLKKLFEAGLSHISISIEGFNSKTHDEVTGIKGSFNQTLNGIENCVKNNLDFCTITTISYNNISFIDKIIAFICEKKVKDIVLNVETSLQENKNLPSFSNVARIIWNAYNYCHERNVNFYFNTPLPFCIFKENELNELLSNNAISSGRCSQLYEGRGVVFDYDGGILPCTHFVGLPFGNIIKRDKIISKNKFIKWFNSGNCLNFRHKINKYRSQKCIECKYKLSCGGGCPIFWVSFDPKVELKGFNL